MSKMNADEVTQYEFNTWGRCAGEYLDTFAGLTSQAIPFLLESVGDCRGRQVLDLGSGPGNVAEVFVVRGAEVMGADFSPQMVEVAQSRYPHISFKEANGENLPFADGAFDAVVCNYVVHHVNWHAKLTHFGG
jgi:ubiquinone/menaquinone biosynthesis C-methylase UbiE